VGGLVLVTPRFTTWLCCRYDSALASAWSMPTGSGRSSVAPRAGVMKQRRWPPSRNRSECFASYSSWTRTVRTW